MPIFEVYQKDKLFWRYTFDQQKILIGRNDDNDIVLKDSIVSRLHATIERQKNQIVLVDNSTNGTFVNTKRVEKQIPLSNEDRIIIGDFTLLFRAVEIENLAPHHLTYYAQDLAATFHAFYRDCRVVSSDPADAELTKARLRLVKAAKLVLARTLTLMGVDAPEQM